MNIQRYALPALLAAAIHAALLLAIPPTEVDAIIRAPEPPGIVLPPLPPIVYERPTVRPPDDTATRRVRPVEAGGGPPRPELDARLERSHRDFEIPPDSLRRTKGPPAHVVSPLPPGEFVTPGPWRGAPPPELFDASQLDRPPRARFQPAPDYPAELRRDGVEGEVVVAFEVDREGRVVSARAVGGDRAFAAAAVRAVLRWRFEPGRSEGRPVAFRMTVPVGFSLAGG